MNATEAASQVKDQAHEKVKANAAKAQAAADAPPLTEAPAGGGAPPPDGDGGSGMTQPWAHIAKWNETTAWEPAKAKTRLTKWANAVRVSTTAHGRLATDFERNERRLSMVLVMVNASISSSIFISISDSPLKIYLQVFAGVCSLFAAVLTAWKTELKWAERSEGHRNATRGFVKILHRFAHQLDMIQACPVDKDGKLLKEWSEIIKDWEELEAESPQIPAAAYDKWNGKTVDPETPGQK